MLIQKNKGQGILGLPFVFIIALIITAIIVIFAVSTIKNFSCQQDLIMINLFVSNLRSEIESAYYSTVESQTIFNGELPLPNGCSSVKYVCFGFPDRSDFSSATSASDEISRYSGQNKQLFFYPNEGLWKIGAQQSYEVKLLNVSTDPISKNPLCIQNTGEIELLLLNKGRYVLVEQR